MHSEEKASILVIDDSLADLRILTEMMAMQKMRISVAFNGSDGYERAILQQPDLILLDVRMPGMDGFATCRLLKANAKTSLIPVIFLTAASDPEERVEGLTLGAVDYVCKPFAEQEVIARVNIHLRLAQGRGQPAALAAAAGQEESPGHSRDAVLTAAAVNHLQQNLRTAPTSEALARQLGTNEKRLNQAFQSCFAMSASEWLRNERLQQARHLLTHTDTSIAQIGDHLGYSSPANFAKAFRERFGCSPRELRLAPPAKD